MLKAAKVVGLNSDTAATLALISFSPPQESGSPEPTLGLFAIISCEKDDAFSLVRQALFEAQNTFDETRTSLPERLSAVGKVIKDACGGEGETQFLLAATQEDKSGSVLYLLKEGDFLEAYLIREGKLTNLSKISEPGELVSGLLEGKDRVVLATNSLVELVGEGLGVLSRLPLENLEDEVTGLLPEAQPYPVAAVLIENREEEEISEIKLPYEEKKNRIKISLPKPPVFISALKTVVPRGRRGMLIIGLMLLATLVIGSIISFQKGKNKEISQGFQNNYEKAAISYSRAIELKDSDRQNSLGSLNEARVALAEALKIKPDDEQAINLKRQIEEKLPEIIKTYKITDFPLWLDLDLLKKGFSADRLSVSVGNLLILDPDKKTLVLVDLNNKSPQILAGEDKLGKAKFASLNGDVALVFSEDLGIVKIDIKNTTANTVVKYDKEWGEVTDLYGFAGNIYLFDGSQIWKYLPIASGYSEKRGYFKSSSDIGNIRRMHIDSSVWLLKNGTDLIKYTQGVSDFFSINGLEKPLKNIKTFFVSDKTESVYLIDSENNRLVVFDKKGNYIAQYESERFGSFDDFIVDEKLKKAYFLEGSKIFQMDLR